MAIIVTELPTIDVMNGIVRDLSLLHILASVAAMTIHQEHTVRIYLSFLLLLIFDDKLYVPLLSMA